MLSRAYIPLNALGGLCSVGYAGYVITPSHTPWGGFLSTCLFFVAAIVPILSEYRRLNTGFQDFESSYLENRKREQAPPKQEVIGPTDHQPTSRIAKPRNKTPVFLYALSVISVISLLSDAAYRYSHLPPEPETPNLISNF